MGIKGIYQEIGNGKRLALAKLADDHIKKHNRPFRIAIDTSIWLFQIQASEGGSSPEIRTLYYRLVRLLLYGIRAIFVFDGPDKPPFKRNAPTSSGSPSSNRIAKRLIELFGFSCHDAPGEAEAECALLQKLGIVDAVLSEDVDTLAFGCTLSIRSWTSEGSRGNKAPTHVTIYDANEIKQGKSGLGREGMILVALMSGGDYLPEGIPGCGTKVACEAARAGFGQDLCEIKTDDETEFMAWRERLCHELKTNESGFFKTRHKALVSRIPESFPDQTVLNFHANPVVSNSEKLLALQDTLNSNASIDIKGIRDFVDEEFNWRHLSGAKKFLRQISPAILAHKLRSQAVLWDGSRDMEEQAEREERLLLAILNRRMHFSMDGIPELKVVYIPEQVADLDLDQETIAEDDDNAQFSSDDEEIEVPAQIELSNDGFTHEISEDVGQPSSTSAARKKRSKLAEWDYKAPQKTWLLERPVSLGAPLSLAQWNVAAEKKAQEEDVSKRGGMRQGALETYLRVVKPSSMSMPRAEVHERKLTSNNPDGFLSQPADLVADVAIKPVITQASRTQTSKMRKTTSSTQKKGKPVGKQQRKHPPVTIARETNPWTLAQGRKGIYETAHWTQEQRDGDLGLGLVVGESLENPQEQAVAPMGETTITSQSSSATRTIEMVLE